MMSFAEAGVILLTLGAAAAGGALFAVLHLPAPWMTGSMLAVAALAIAGAPLSLPKYIRYALFLVTGVSTGSAFSPESAAGLLKWPASIASLGATVVLVVVLSVAFLVIYAKWDRATALFASMPGALSAVLVTAMRSEADIGLVVLSQLFRLFVLVAVLPLVVMISVPQSALHVSALHAASYRDIGIEMAVGAAVGLGLEWLRFPAGLLVGGMLTSAAIHGSGAMTGLMPSSVLIPCQIALGAFIGSRFQSANLGLLRKALAPAAGSFLIAGGISGVAALVVAWALHLPSGMVLVAFAPGGLEAMSMLAFALDLDPAFVGAHQIIRFLGISLLMPVVAKLYVSLDNERSRS